MIMYCSVFFQYALKKISPRKLDTNYMNEATVLCSLNHSNVLAYKACFKDGDSFCIVMEYCPRGDLRKEIDGRRRNHQTFTESEIVNWTIQLCHALQVRIQVYSRNFAFHYSVIMLRHIVDYYTVTHTALNTLVSNITNLCEWLWYVDQLCLVTVLFCIALSCIISVRRSEINRIMWKRSTVIIIIIIILLTMFMVLSSWHSHCESSPGSFDECWLSAGWPPTLRPNQPIWAVSPPKDWLLPSADTIAIYYYYSALILILPSHGGWKAEST